MTAGASERYDIVAIGGGSAGLAIGKYGAVVGGRTAIVEQARLGGDCTWTGCVPSKALLAAGNAAAALKRTERFGLPPAQFDPAAGPIDFAKVIDRVHAQQQKIYERSDSPEELRELGCDVIEGRARFISPDALEVQGRRVESRYFCIATGSRAAVPPIPGLDQVEVLTNANVFGLRDLPARLLVVGGGPIGLELGQAFSRLGSEVTIVELAPEILPREDPELAAILREQLVADGLRIQTGTGLKRVEPGSGAGPHVTILEQSGEETSYPFDRVFVAVGQLPNVDDLGLEEAGVVADRRSGIEVNGTLRTSNPRIHAIGDVRGAYQFTHSSARDGIAVMRNALFPGSFRPDGELTPRAVFTDLEMANVGLSEEEARAEHGDKISGSRVRFTEIDRAVVEQRDVGLVKLITRAKNERVLGAQIVGPAAGELIHEFVLAIQAGWSAQELMQTVHIYPTLSETPRFSGQDATIRWMGTPWVRRAFKLKRRWDRIRGRA